MKPGTCQLSWYLCKIILPGLFWSIAPIVHSRIIHDQQNESSEGHIPRGWPKVSCGSKFPWRHARSKQPILTVLTLLTVLSSEPGAYPLSIHFSICLLHFNKNISNTKSRISGFVKILFLESLGAARTLKNKLRKFSQDFEVKIPNRKQS